MTLPRSILLAASLADFRRQDTRTNYTLSEPARRLDGAQSLGFIKLLTLLKKDDSRQSVFYRVLPTKCKPGFVACTHGTYRSTILVLIQKGLNFICPATIINYTTENEGYRITAQKIDMARTSRLFALSCGTSHQLLLSKLKGMRDQTDIYVDHSLNGLFFSLLLE